MNSSDLNDIPSVRLASGVEMQQRWPPSVHTEQHTRQKNREVPRLIDMSPRSGNQGTIVTVVVQSLPHQVVPVKLAFNSLVVDTKQMQAQGITSLVAAVPPFHQTHSTTANVPISICILDKDSVTETWPVAEFAYEFENEDSTTTPTLTSASTNSSTEPLPIDYPNNEKRNDITPNHYTSREENFLGGSSNVSYEGFYQQPINSYNTLNDSQIPQYSYQYSSISRRAYNDNKYVYPINNGGRAVGNISTQPINNIGFNGNANSVNLFNSNSAGFTGVLTGFNQNGPSLSQQTTPLSYTQTSQPSNPSRTFSGPSLPKKPTPSPVYGCNKTTVHVPSTSVANYQPYPGLVSRANLKIMGDLDSMAKNWAPEEWDNRRRLVRFWREQNGVEIRCTFDPVSQGERISTNSGHIVVSCIYWAERNDCFITSVDCIHLLESLMDIRFSVEEKNRVRRNLEGFRPLTVSKCKAESADFFKLIMSFPNPKPRNIEKDVKVFPWKTLPYALKKIVTKYTASSYNGTGNHSQQRRTQIIKNTVDTPTDKPPTTGSIAASYVNSPSITQTSSANQQDSMNGFYSQPNMYQPHQQQYNAYQSQANEQMPAPSMYQPSSSITPYSSTYTQSHPNQASSPVAVNTPSPDLRYSYNDMINHNNNVSTTMTSSEPLNTPLVTPTVSALNQDASPSFIRRPSFDNQREYLVSFKAE
ncbi:hypothetical protein MFLAVUS_002666 [Mucor flavus]|uniref:DUF7082 domain-containing protein n=1 Tax=Mucor flavus TaxID=439312 RepID=A0ABP9YQW4_9FUNG